MLVLNSNSTATKFDYFDWTTSSAVFVLATTGTVGRLEAPSDARYKDRVSLWRASTGLQLFIEDRVHVKAYLWVLSPKNESFVD